MRCKRSGMMHTGLHRVGEDRALIGTRYDSWHGAGRSETAGNPAVL